MTNIAGLFTPQAIVGYLKSLTKIKTAVMDSIFTDRPQVPLPIVGKDIITAVVRALPVVRRGAPAFSIRKETGQVDFFEPLPIRPKDTVSGQELNNLKLLNKGGLTEWAKNKTDFFRRSIRATVEPMCALATSGSYTWPVQREDGGFDSWEIDFGSPLSVTPAKLWSAADAKIVDVFNVFQAMEEEMQTKGFGADVDIWAGKTAYSTLFGLAEKVTATSKIKVEVRKEYIDVAGFRVQRRAERYLSPSDGTATAFLGDKVVRMIDKSGGHKLPYCAIDDLDGKLQPLPFFIKPKKIDDPSGYRLIAESKPFPVVNVDAICNATVVA